MGQISRRRVITLGAGAALGLSGGIAAADPATAASDWRRLVVVTANIGRKHKDQRERAIRDVRHAVEDATPIVGWQEIGEGDDDAKEARWINTWFGPRYRNIFEETEHTKRVPISIPKAYDILDRRVTDVHGGKSGVTPHRVITQALLARADDPKLRFVVANTHYVAGAWNNKTDKHEAWRDDMWRRHFRTHRDNVLGHWRDEGFPVIWTGDVNRRDMPLLLPRYEKRAFARGIDQIGWVGGSNGTQLRLRRTRGVDLHVDSHDARVAVFEIRRR